MITSAMLALAGASLLALQTVGSYLLSIVAGNSVYALCSATCAFLIGLGLGASGARRWLRNHAASVGQIALLELMFAATVMLSTHGWVQIPGYFASFGQFPLARDFVSREFVRITIGALMLGLPALLLGALVPLALDLAVHAGKPEHSARSLGRALASATLGGVVGALAGGLWLIPRLGSLRAIQVLAGLGFCCFCGRKANLGGNSQGRGC